MKQNQYRIQSSSDQLSLDVLEVLPFCEIKGVVQISHGMAEHKERYIEFMNFLAFHGYVAVIHDHRGHGKSIKHPEDKGYFYDDHGEYIVQDLYDVTKLMREKYPQVPYYLFGHSMGSLVVRQYLKKYDDQIDKLIVCGSPSQNPLASLALALVSGMEKVKGSMHRSQWIQTMAFGGYDKQFDEEQENRWLSANQENVRLYNAHADDGFIFTLNGFKNLFTLMKNVYSKEGWQMKHTRLPIFFIAGAQDPVIVSKEDWRKAQVFLNTLGYTNVRGKLYANMRHEILNEDRKEEVMEDILSFIEDK